MNKNIVLYSTGCPACKNLKLMLEKAGIEYVENNNVDEILALGITQVPVLGVNGELISYENAKKWVKLNNKGESR